MPGSAPYGTIPNGPVLPGSRTAGCGVAEPGTRGYSLTTHTGSSGQVTQTGASGFTVGGREQFKFLDMGYGVELGIKFPNDIFSCGLRYSHSLSTILKDTKTNARTSSLLQLGLSAKLASSSG